MNLKELALTDLAEGLPRTRVDHGHGGIELRTKGRKAQGLAQVRCDPDQPVEDLFSVLQAVSKGSLLEFCARRVASRPVKNAGEFAGEML